MKFSMREKIKKVSSLKRDFTGRDVSEVILISFEEFGEELAMTTAFGYSGIVLMSFIKETVPDLPIYFIDTRLHFQETIDLMNKIKNEWKLNIHHLYPNFNDKELDNIIGKKAYTTNPDICCHYRKVMPLLKILETKSAWLSAIRRDQFRTRANIEVIEIDGRGMIKINPMWNWTKEKVWIYIKKQNLPYNPLHDKNFPSIGCKPCTSPVIEGEDEREGRWKGLAKKECGIHIPESSEQFIREMATTIDFTSTSITVKSHNDEDSYIKRRKVIK
ncbi:MAG: phosphoadenylyl-sulfate reductase [Candidatus Thorarchaeota archaeon]